jgi:glycerol uptake facilitator-like aquaporin
MLVAEFLGTGILTLAVLSVQRSQLGLAYFVAIAAGLTVALLTYVLGNVSGSHLNPALTLALWTARRVKTVPALTYIAAQLLGAWAAYGLYHYFVHTNVQAVAQDFSGRILVAEAIGTMVFALGWAYAAYNRVEEGRFAAVAGLSFAVAIIIASAASVGLANPALAEGVRAWEVFGENGWGNYVLGPVLGAIIGVNLYGLLFADVDRPFSALRRGKTAGTDVGTVSTSSVVSSNETDVDDEDAVDPDLAVNSNAKAGTNRVAPRSKVTKSAKAGAKKSAKKTSSRKK